jgi:hypothetical protein
MASARPTVITVLSILHVLCGVGGLFLLIPLLANLLNSFPDAAAILSVVGIPPISMPLVILVVSVVVIASGIGMWKGYRWGWHIGCLYYFYLILIGISNILLSAVMLNYFKEKLPDDALDAITEDLYGGFILQLIKIGASFVIPFTIYIYFYSHAVKEYFNVTKVSNILLTLKHIGIFFVFSINYGLST